VIVWGTVGNLLTQEDVTEKCKSLMAPVIGEIRTRELIDKIWNLENVKDVRTLRPLLSAPFVNSSTH